MIDHITIGYFAAFLVLIVFSGSAERKPLHRASLWLFCLACLAFGAWRLLGASDAAVLLDFHWLEDLGNHALLAFALCWIVNETPPGRRLRTHIAQLLNGSKTELGDRL